METKENETPVRIELTGAQKRKISSWTGCDFSHAEVSAFPEGVSNTPGKTIAVTLTAEQIKRIENGFSDLKVTGNRMIILPVLEEEVIDKPVQAVLEKWVPKPSRPKADSSSIEPYSSSDKDIRYPEEKPDDWENWDSCCTTE